MVSTTEIGCWMPGPNCVYKQQSTVTQSFLIAIQLRGEEVADIQAMFNATRPWLLLIPVIKDNTSNFLSAISFN